MDNDKSDDIKVLWFLICSLTKDPGGEEEEQEEEDDDTLIITPIHEKAPSRSFVAISKANL